MKGKTIYLTRNERSLIAQAVICYIETMESGDDTLDIVRDELKKGLRSGLDKLLKLD